MKIWIGEEYDGFEIRVYGDDWGESQFSVRIDQEDSIEDIQKLFDFLGYETDYEEVF